MATLTTMDHVALGAMCGGIAITLFNKALTDGARNGAARVAWFLTGVAFARAVYGGIIGLLYALEAGTTVAGSRAGGHIVLHRDEHPIVYWLTVCLQTAAMGIVIVLTLVCFVKVFTNVLEGKVGPRAAGALNSTRSAGRQAFTGNGSTRGVLIFVYWSLSVFLYIVSMLSLAAGADATKGVNSAAGVAIAIGACLTMFTWRRRGSGTPVWSDMSRKIVSLAGWTALAVSLVIAAVGVLMSANERSPASPVEASFGLLFYWMGRMHIGDPQGSAE
ncbi:MULTISPECIES: hypothetical protein [Dyella]|uniref:Uncharacterized protein n=2 Tax=Dyella TaxID=231454 RepID=A0A4R0YYA5_9GAMM|nr:MULTISPECIES: hypothetical protein [Dyella]TBR40409.1 hypothetical protein EYV96_09700 [Dyella terrae]TCI12008.1 hypothetical protein EZM97_01170 [Dyella soli]